MPLMVCAFLALMALLVTRLTRDQFEESLRQHETIDLRDETRLKASEIADEISQLRQDVLALSRHSTVSEFANSGGAFKDLSVEHIETLKRAFMATCRLQEKDSTKGHREILKPYLQVRLLDKDGMEVLRLNKLDRSELLTDTDFEEQANLQLKKHSPYFADTEKYPNHVYLSEIEANVESGGAKTGQEGLAVLRAACAVRDTQQNFSGVVVINMEFDEAIRGATSGPRHLTYLTSSLNETKADRLLLRSSGRTKTVRGQLKESVCNLADALTEDFGNWSVRQGEEVSDDSLDRDGQDDPYVVVAGRAWRTLNYRGQRLDLNAKKDPFYITKLKTTNDTSWIALNELLKSEFERQDTTFRSPPEIEVSTPVFSVRDEHQRELTTHVATLTALGLETVYEKVESTDFIGYYFRIYIDPNHPERYLGFLQAFSRQELEADSATQNDDIVKVIFAACMLAVIAICFTRWWVTKPLNVIARAADAMTDKNRASYIQYLPLERSDEIGSLARSFDKMRENVRSNEMQIKARERKLRAIVDTAVEGIISVDSDGRIDEFNPAASQLFGCSRDDVKGKRIHDLFVLDEASGEELELRLQSDQRTLAYNLLHKSESATSSGVIHETRIEASKPFEVNACRFGADGDTRFPAEVSIGSIGDPGAGQQSKILMVRDITERSRIREEREQRNEYLKRAVENRTRELRVAITQRDHFMARISHDLKTPLTAIKGRMQLLARSIKKALNADDAADVKKIVSASRENITKAQGQVDYLDELFTEITAFQDIVSGKRKVNASPFDLKDVIGSQVEDHQRVARQRNTTISVTYSGDTGLDTDMTRVTRILQNLLSNACKFTDDGTIAVTAAATDGIVTVEVKDSGDGIDDDRLKTIFEPYGTQIDRKRNPEGTGLGLSIARGFARSLHGDLTVSSELGVGSTFRLTFPSHFSQPPPIVQKSKSIPPAGAERTALVIDDDPTIREQLRTLLSNEGFLVLEAGNGEEGLRLVSEHRPDLITLDMIMPGKDGWEVLSKLRESPDTNQIPVIVVSMLANDENIQLGANQLVPKPVSEPDLLSVVRSLAQSASPRVLIVDDNLRDQKYHGEILSNNGCSVDFASNGAEALRVLENNSFDIILLDLFMPVMDGSEFLETARLSNLKTPIVLLSADPDGFDEEHEEMVVHVMRKGALSEKDFLATVRKFTK